jgi:hypothetical protein
VTLNPGIIALLLSSCLTALMMAYAAWFGLGVLRGWDLKSGAEVQLRLERRTYLVSTLLAYVLRFEVLALFLFIQTAERLHPLFVGAMCAAGTLFVNPFGYPALGLRILLASIAGLWLILNWLDTRAPDYPLIRTKYGMLILMAPLAVASAALSLLYLTGLRADVITSCCGSLFSQGSESVREEIPLLGANLALYIYMAASALVFIVGVFYYRTGRGPLAFCLLSALMLPLGLYTLTAFVSPYIYELPTHHCPFCMLQGDYHYIGYIIYASLLSGTVLGMSAGASGALKGLSSMEGGPEGPRRMLTLASLVSFALFTLIAIWSVVSSNLRM